jgi:hypothetical protein
MKKRVIVVWAPERPAVLIAEGPQVSEIMWLDDRTIQCLPNDQMVVEETVRPSKPE